MREFAVTSASKNKATSMESLVGRSFTYAVRTTCAPSGTGRPMKFGDRIHVRLARVQPGGNVLADFVLDNVNDMTEVFGELRFHTRGIQGLATLYVRNITRGWAFTQPFKLYDDFRRPAVSVSHPITQPVTVSDRAATVSRTPASGPRKRELPESIRLLFGEH